MEDLFSLEGRNAVVLGAGGMGAAIAAGLLRFGARLEVADRDAAGLARCATNLAEAGYPTVGIHEVDATDESSMQALVEATVASMGKVDILVNALGYNFKANATEFPMDEWDRLFNVNVRAVMMACKLFGAHMIEQGGGKIINLSSVRDDRGALGGNAGYCATKGAVKMITKQLASSRAVQGLRQRAWTDHHRDTHDRRTHQAGLLSLRAHAVERADGPHGRRGGPGRSGRVPRVVRVGLHHRYGAVRRWRHDGLRLRQDEERGP